MLDELFERLINLQLAVFAYVNIQLLGLGLFADLSVRVEITALQGTDGPILRFIDVLIGGVEVSVETIIGCG